MANLIIKPQNVSGDKVIIQDQAGGAVLTTADSGATWANATLPTPTIANMSNCTFPSGKVNNVFRLSDSASGEYLNTSNDAKVPANAMSWSATSGRHYLVFSCCPVWPYRHAGNNSGRTQYTRLYVGTVNRNEGDVQNSTSTDTILFQDHQGRNLTSAQSSGTQSGYYVANMQGLFTAGSTATHYVYLTIHTASADIAARFGSAANHPWTVIIYEVMP